MLRAIKCRVLCDQCESIKEVWKQGWLHVPGCASQSEVYLVLFYIFVWPTVHIFDVDHFATCAAVFVHSTVVIKCENCAAVFVHSTVVIKCENCAAVFVHSTVVIKCESCAAVFVHSTVVIKCGNCAAVFVHSTVVITCENCTVRFVHSTVVTKFEICAAVFVHSTVVTKFEKWRAGQNYTYMHIYGVHTVFLAGELPYLHTIIYNVHKRFWPTLEVFHHKHCLIPKLPKPCTKQIYPIPKWHCPPLNKQNNPIPRYTPLPHT